MLGPAWRRGCGLKAGDRVAVELEAEGPQRRDLAPDLAAAFEASPSAAAFWDELAQFYRRGLPAMDRRDEAQPGAPGAADRRRRHAARAPSQGATVTDRALLEPTPSISVSEVVTNRDRIPDPVDPLSQPEVVIRELE